MFRGINSKNKLLAASSWLLATTLLSMVVSGAAAQTMIDGPTQIRNWSNVVVMDVSGNASVTNTFNANQFFITGHPELGITNVVSPVAIGISNGGRTGCPSACVTTLTLTTYGPPNSNNYYVIGTTILVTGAADATFNGTFTISAINPGASQITYTQTGQSTNPGSIGGGGTVAIYDLELSGHTLRFNRFQSTSSNPAQTGSIQFGPTDSISYRCATNCPGGVSPTDFILARGAGNGTAQIGDVAGVQLPGFLGFSVWTNSPNGTTVNKTVIADSANPGQIRTALTTTTNGILGICVRLVQCTTSGNPVIANTGPATLVMDNAGPNNNNDLVCPSSTTAGAGTDCGTTIATVTSQIIGIIQSSQGGGLYTVYISMGFSQGGGAASGVLLTPASNQTITPTVSSVVPLITQCPSGAASGLNCWQVNNAAGTTILGMQQNGILQVGTGVGGGSIATSYTGPNANPAASGLVRCSNTDTCMGWRNNANNADITLVKNSSDVVTLNAAALTLSGGPLNLSAAGIGLLNGVSLAGPFGVAGIPYNTVSAATNGNIGSTTLVTAGGSGDTYRIGFFITQTALGTSCSTSTTVQVPVTYTPPNAAGTSTPTAIWADEPTLGVFSQSFTITTNGSVGLSAYSVPMTLSAKANTAVSYTATLVAGTGCSPAPTYQVYPIVEVLR